MLLGKILKEPVLRVLVLKACIDAIPVELILNIVFNLLVPKDSADVTPDDLMLYEVLRVFVPKDCKEPIFV